MSNSNSNHIGIQYGHLSQTIEAGRLNKAGDLFLDKSDMTNQAIAGVADLVEHTLDGHGVFTIGSYKVEVQVHEHPHRKNQS